MNHIISAEKLNDHYATYEIEAADIAAQARAGQVVLVRMGDTLLRPVPVTSVDSERATLTIIDAVQHNGTDPGELAVELRGPFGEESSDHATRVLCVAQGLGVAALISKLEAYKERGAYTIVVAGFSSADHIFWKELLDGLSEELYIVTDDGSFGIKGPIRDTVRAICQNVSDIERVVAAGSLPLLKSCAKIADDAELPLFISLAAVAEPHSDDVPPLSEALAAFDWSRTELDGHKANYDDLKKQLGLFPAK